MTENEELSPEQLRKAAEELQAFSLDLQGKLDDAKTKHEQTMRRYRFTSHDRANYWKMPKWLWVPIVGSLIFLFLVALLSAG